MLPGSVQQCDVGVAVSTSMDPSNRKLNYAAVLICKAPQFREKMASYQIGNGRILRTLTRSCPRLVLRCLYIHIILCWFRPPAATLASPLMCCAVLSCMMGRQRGWHGQ
jgi:hypothetical protein